MIQKKRREKTSGLGYYTYWDKRQKNGCIYCGAPAFTREHIPSKAFLVEPYPENLPTIPACFECNNGFSLDEQYCACFLEILKTHIFEGYICNRHISHILEKTPSLKNLILSQINISDGIVNFELDKNRFTKIINKLAIGHSGYEFDNVTFEEPKTTWFDFEFNLTSAQKEDFLELPITNKLPEISSRFTSSAYIVENVETGEFFVLNTWCAVQEKQYSYCVFLNRTGGITVRMIISDLLYCQVEFD